jgi:NADH dehydrogenase FAD-containing subunit
MTKPKNVRHYGILPEMPEKLRNAARKVLEERGVELVLSARVKKAASPNPVYPTDGRSFDTRTFVCTVRNAPASSQREASGAPWRRCSECR